MSTRPTPKEIAEAAASLDELWSALKERQAETSYANGRECDALNAYNTAKKQYDALHARFLEGRNKS